MYPLIVNTFQDFGMHGRQYKLSGVSRLGIPPIRMPVFRNAMEACVEQFHPRNVERPGIGYQFGPYLVKTTDLGSGNPDE